MDDGAVEMSCYIKTDPSGDRIEKKKRMKNAE
jgi:hypothetical protein